MSHNRLRIAAIAAAFCVSVVVFLRLPALFGARSGWGLDFVPRAATSFLLPAAAIVVLLIFRSLSARDPLRKNYERFRRTYEILLDIVVLLILGTHFLLLAKLMVWRVRIGPWISYVPTTIVGIALLVAGNVLPRLRPNSVMGIRTRWTLRDETVWVKTHRSGGYVVLAFGLALLVWTFIDFQGIWWVLAPGILVTMVGLPLLSFIYWRAGSRSRSQRPENSKEV